MDLREGPQIWAECRKKQGAMEKKSRNNAARWKKVQENVMIQKVLRKAYCMLAMA